MSDSETAGATDWSAVKADYDNPALPIVALLKKHHVSQWQLYTHANQQGWLRRTVRVPASAKKTAVARLKALVQRRLTELENTMERLGAELTAVENEREIRAMSLLARTLDKVLELERKHRARTAKRRGGRPLDDARRRELTRRLDALCQEPVSSAASGGAEPAGG